jgi:cytochrome b561
MPVQGENSRDRYGFIAQTLHWVVALLFLGAFVAVYFRQWVTKAHALPNLFALQAHLTLGLSVLVFVGLRLGWRWRSPMMPEELPGLRWEHVLASAAHIALYGLMLAMPLTGYLGTGVGTEFFGIVTIPRFADTWLFNAVVEQRMGLTFEEFEKPIDWLHKTLGEVMVLVLVGLHVAAAFFHHYVRRDGALQRMLLQSRH